jgi:hypothetical protein
MKFKVESSEDGVDFPSSTKHSPKVKSVNKFYGNQEEALEDVPLSLRKSSRLASKVKVC